MEERVGQEVPGPCMKSPYRSLQVLGFGDVDYYGGSQRFGLPLLSLLCCHRVIAQICVVHNTQNDVHIPVRKQREKAGKEHINSDKDQFWKLHLTSAQVPLAVI